MEAALILETAMVVAFGVSWPGSVIKSWHARTAKGKSLFFLCMIFAGYLCGIAARLLAGGITYVLFFYILNLAMVGTDIAIYFRNKRLDRAEGANE